MIRTDALPMAGESLQEPLVDYVYVYFMGSRTPCLIVAAVFEARVQSPALMCCVTPPQVGCGAALLLGGQPSLSQKLPRHVVSGDPEILPQHANPSGGLQERPQVHLQGRGVPQVLPGPLASRQVGCGTIVLSFQRVNLSHDSFQQRVECQRVLFIIEFLVKYVSWRSTGQCGSVTWSCRAKAEQWPGRLEWSTMKPRC